MGIQPPKVLVERAGRVAREGARKGLQGAGVVARSTQIKRFRDKHGVLRLSLGNGPNAAPGWMGLDLTPKGSQTIYADLRRTLPFEDASVEAIHSEHLLEHLSFDDGRALLGECHRILAPGRRIRIATPDAVATARLIAGVELDPDQQRWVSEAAERHPEVPPAVRDSPLFVVNRMFNDHGHRFLYDRRVLTWALEDAGFGQLTWHEVGESEDPALRGLEQHGRHVGEVANRAQTMICEAVA